MLMRLLLGSNLVFTWMLLTSFLKLKQEENRLIEMMIE